MTQLVSPPVLKSCVSPPVFPVPPRFKVFQTVHPHAIPSCPNPTDQPSLHIINRFKQISKGWFYQFNCHFLSKVSFLFFWFPSQTYQVVLIHGIFSGSFLHNLEWLFFIKLWWRTILQRVKWFNKVIISCRMHHQSFHQLHSECVLQVVMTF